MVARSRTQGPTASPASTGSIRLERVGWELAVLAAVLLGCKVQRLATVRDALAGDRWSVVSVWVHNLTADAVFLFAYGLFWGILTSVARDSRMIVIAFRTTTVALMALALTDHAFLILTGATLDWHILRYGIAHFVELKPVLLSVGKHKLGVLAGSLVGITLLPHTLRHLRARWPGVPTINSAERQIVLGRLGWSVSLVCFALSAQSCWSATSAPTSPADSSPLLLHNLYVRLGKTAISDWQRGHRNMRRHASVLPEQLTTTRPERHHNIVLIVLESARARSFSPYGNGIDATPFFEELAQRGALVENAYTVAPHTTKALLSIQCGIYPRLDPEPYEAVEKGIPVRCLPDLLRDVGYRSAFFQPAEENFESRRDLVREFGYEHFAGKQSLHASGFDESNYLGFEDRALLRPVMDWVDGQSRPFLLTVLTLASHHPYAIPSGFAANSFAEDRAENDYLNTLAYTDNFLRELYGEFEARRLLGDTIFVVLGDHGEAFGEHGVRQHDAVPYEEGLRVPMVWIGPPFKPGHRVTGLRQHIDVLPTILEAAGFRLDEPSRPGQSMLSSRGHDRLYFSCHYRDYCLAGRDAREKVIQHYTPRRTELFDLLVDPDEKLNLAARRSLEVAAWVDDLQKWKAHVGAQFTEGRQWHVMRSVSRSAPTLGHELEVDFGPDIRLLGYDIERTQLPIGEQLTISHHFYVERKPDPSFAFVFHLLGPRSEDLTHAPVAGSYPLSQWQTGDYITDRFTYFARPGTPQGQYQLMVGLWRNRRSSQGGATPRALTESAVIDNDRRVQTAAFGIVAPPFEREEYVYSTLPPGRVASETMLTSEIGLLDCTLTKDRVKRGLKTTLSCVYHARQDNPAGRLCVTLQGPTTRSITHTPVRGTYPVNEWKADQYVRDDVDLYMTTADKDGEYLVTVGVEVEASEAPANLPCQDAGAHVDVGRLTLGE